jgi:hypothetical protein
MSVNLADMEIAMMKCKDGNNKNRTIGLPKKVALLKKISLFKWILLVQKI